MLVVANSKKSMTVIGLSPTNQETIMCIVIVIVGDGDIVIVIAMVIVIVAIVIVVIVIVIVNVACVVLVNGLLLVQRQQLRPLSS